MIKKFAHVIMLALFLAGISRAANAEELKATISAPSALLNTQDHISYMDIKDGCFRPDDPLTRGEAAKMFYALLKDKPAAPGELFPDVKDTEYNLEANSVCAVDIMRGYNGKFSPLDFVSRAELVSELRRCFPNEPDAASNTTFNDVPEDYWGKDAIAFAIKRGWLSADSDGNLHPEQPITRAEAVSIINKALGRSADQDAVTNGENIRILLDVPQDYWAFFQIEEATIGHEFTKDSQGGEHWTSWTAESTGLPTGPYLFEGELYYINDNGQIVRSADIGVRHYDQNGRYTTLEPDLDRLLTQVILENTSSDMSLLEKRQALFKYIRDSYVYIQRPNPTKDDIGWETSYALRFFKEGRGNCYSFAAGYGELLRKIGYDVEFIVGEVTYHTYWPYSPHGWVEIQTPDGIRIDDPEFERAHRNDDFFSFTYETAPAYYRK